MLGKRFRRTTSMTQLGPPSPSQVTANGNRAADAAATIVPHIAVTSLQVADPMATEQDPPPHRQPILSGTLPFQEHMHYPPPPPPPPFAVPWTGYQDNTFLHVTKPTVMMMSGYGKVAEHQYHGVTISPVGFLDMCFFCKRRLRHERDIFIYRGDTAFCSEECRHRQILSDERRAATSNQRKGGPDAATNASETAVAA